MAKKPENTYIGRLHKQLPKEVYRMKTHNPYVAGIPDCYYSALGGDLWVEYKYIIKLPVRVPVEAEVTALQFAWLAGRHHEGRNVAVIVGSPKGAVIFRITEPLVLSVEDFLARAVSDDVVIKWITQQTRK